MDNDKITEQFKQRMSLSHKIGERPWRSSSQSTLLSLFEKCWKTTSGNL